MKELGKKSLNGNITNCEYCDVKNGFKVCSVKCNESNIVNDWLDKNGNPKIAIQVEKEAEEMEKQQQDEFAIGFLDRYGVIVAKEVIDGILTEIQELGWNQKKIDYYLDVRNGVSIIEKHSKK